jgi:hypothetical protein
MNQSTAKNYKKYDYKKKIIFFFIKYFYLKIK